MTTVQRVWVINALATPAHQRHKAVVPLDVISGGHQRCPQDVKSQDRDETEMVNLQDRDETETFQKNVSRPQCRSLKTLPSEVCHVTNCFLRVRTIIFFMIYLQT